MGKRVFSVACQWFFLAALALGVSAVSAAPADKKPDAKPEKPIAQVPWTKVPTNERKVLVPLEKDWNQLPGIQQRRFIDSAKQYPKMAPIQQERFQDRLKEWAKLTPEQRKVAREKYRNLSSLPPEKQYELREKWSEKSLKPAETTPSSMPTSASTAPPAQ